MFKDEEAMLTRYSLHMALREAMGDRNLATMEELELYRDNKWVSATSWPECKSLSC